MMCTGFSIEQYRFKDFNVFGYTLMPILFTRDVGTPKNLGVLADKSKLMILCPRS